MDNNEDKSAELNSIVLVIHRDFDVGTALHHSWTYEGLVQEVYKVTNNKATHLSKCKFEMPDAANTQYDLDFGKDFFWQQNLAKEYQEVAEAISKEIADWKREYDSFTQPLDPGAADAKINSGLDAVGEMQDKKVRIDNHFAMIEEIANNIRKRRIDELHRIEIQILKGGSTSVDSENFATLLEMLTDSSRENSGRLTLNDKLRLLTIYLLSRFCEVSP